ncbi:lysylphosphatidylglycerol synthase domain-containing protein [Candidatus Mycoplasma pogonae]
MEEKGIFINHLENWNFYKNVHPLFKHFTFDKSKKISFLRKISRLNSTLKIRDNKIVSVAGDNEEQFNENTISLIAFNYAKLLKQKYEIEDQIVLIAHDEDDESYKFSQIFSTALSHYGIQVSNFSYNNPVPYPVFFYAYKKLNFHNSVYISRKSFLTDNFVFSFKNTKNDIFNKEEIEVLNSKIVPVEIGNHTINKKANINYLNSKIFEDYSKYILENAEENDLDSNLSFSFLSFSDSQNIFITNIFQELKYKVNDNNKNSSVSQKLNLEFSPFKSLKKLSRNVSKEKSDIGFIFQKKGTKLLCVVKHKRLVKYLSYDKLAILYMNYLSQKDHKKIDVLTTSTASQNPLIFANKLAESEITIKDTRRSILAQALKTRTKKLNFAYTENDMFFISKGLPQSGFDSIPFALAILEMAAFYKKQNKNLFEVFQEIEKENGVLHENIETFFVDKEQGLNLISRINQLEEINGVKIVNKKRFDIQENYSNLICKMQDKTQIVIKYNNYKNVLKYFVNVKPEKAEFPIITNKEKRFIDKINLYKEEKPPKIKKQNYIIKYTFLLAFLAVSIFLTFKFLYTNTGGEDSVQIFRDFWTIFTRNTKTRIFFLMIAFSNFVYYAIHAWTIYRMMQRQGIKIKFKHIFMASFIGVCVSNITPFYIGGDIVSFWYLRKKGYNTSALASTFLASTFIFQVNLVVITLSLIPFMFIQYPELFNGKAENIFIVVLLFVGLAINILGFFFYLIISSSKTIQKIIVSVVIYFFELTPLIFVKDPIKISGNKYYAFEKTRQGFRDILKSPKLFLEIFTLRLLTMFFIPTPFVAFASHLLKDNIPLIEGYWRILIGTNIIRAVNSISVAPGGVGTEELITITVLKPLFKEADQLDPQLVIRDGVKIFSFLKQIFFYFIPTITSALALLSVWFGERLLAKKIKVAKNRLLHKNLAINTHDIVVKTNYYKITASIGILATLAIILFLLLI